VSVDLHEDVQFEFPCSAHSDDLTPVSIQWYHVDENTNDEVEVRIIPDKLTVSSNGSMMIRLTKNDTKGWAKFRGQYICRATNFYSEAERLAYIHVNNFIPPGQSQMFQSYANYGL